MTPRTQIAVTYEVTLKLTELEVRALDALVGYGAESFLHVFYKHLGRTYLEPCEAGLRSLFATVGTQIRPELAVIDSARRSIAGALENGGVQCPL